MPPTISELGEPVKKHHAAPLRSFESRFEEMHREAIVVVYPTRADTSRKRVLSVLDEIVPTGSGRPTLDLCRPYS
jgi:hypothetical protein